MLFDDRAAVVRAASLPAVPQAKQPRGLWAAAWDSLKAGGQQTMASALELGRPIGAALAAGGGDLESLDAIKSGEALDVAENDLSRPFRAAARELRPDPATATTAEKVVFGLVGPLAKLVGATVLAGPAGLAAAAGEEGFSQAEDLRRDGVDFGTRTGVGALTAVATAAGAALPMMGPTLAKTAGLYVLGGPGAFVAQQAATREILRRMDYGKVAEQFDPWDPTGLALSALIPLPFAAAGARRNVRAGKAAGRAKEAPPAADPAPAPLPQEAIDAAMVHQRSLLADEHEARIAAGEPAVVVERQPDLSPDPAPVANEPAPVVARQPAGGVFGDLPAAAASRDAAVRSVLQGLEQAAPDVARVGELVNAGARQAIDIAGDVARAVEAMASGKAGGTELPPAVQNILTGLIENARNPRRVAEMIQRMARTVDALGDPRQASVLDERPSAADVAADAVEAMRLRADESFIEAGPPAAPKGAEAEHMRSVQSRAQAIEAERPDMPVRMDADGKPVTVADELARARREAAEGADDALGELDADLVRVAAECALTP